MSQLQDQAVYMLVDWCTGLLVDWFTGKLGSAVGAPECRSVTVKSLISVSTPGFHWNSAEFITSIEQNIRRKILFSWEKTGRLVDWCTGRLLYWQTGRLVY